MGNIYVGVGDKSRRISSMYVGINNIAHKVKQVYVGDANGIARLVWQALVTKFSKWTHFISRTKVYTEANGMNCYTDGLNKPLIVDDNTTVLAQGMRNTDGTFFGYGIIRIVTDSNGNIVSTTNDYVNTQITSLCKMGKYYAVGAYDNSGDSSLHMIDLDNTYYIKRASMNGNVADVYPLTDSSVYGVVNSSDLYQVQLFQTSFDGSNFSRTDKILVANANGGHLIHVSGNQNIVFYYTNNAYYVAPLIYNNINSYSLGAGIQINNNWSLMDTRLCYVIDEHHVLLYSESDRVMGAYINNNSISLSNEITVTNKLCRIGTSNTFFSFDGTTVENGTGRLIYYDTTSNSLSVIGTSVSANTFSNNNGYTPSVYYSAFIPKGENKIVILSSDEFYLHSYELTFNV